MRLLHTTKRKLEEFQEGNIPPYAILSHTWGENEITFQDITGADAMEKTGYEKVGQTCAIAAAHRFDYIWIDRQTGATSPKFSKSRWFTRGWTLQELIGPELIIFLDQQWQEIGTKSALQKEMSRITGIPINILCGDDLNSASIAQRMSWASNRKTTRVEDLAYCLMGMFGINMPLLYGEGQRAFTRLQEEIMKIFDDYSLFAWRQPSLTKSGLLAPSPAAFLNSVNIIPFNHFNSSSGAITVNNKGVHLNLRFKPIDKNHGLAILPCMENGKEVAICLEAVLETNEYFVRARAFQLEQPKLRKFSKSNCLEKSICVRQERRIHKKQSAVFLAAQNGLEVVVQLLLKQGAGLGVEDFNERIPLSIAAANGHEALVRLLLEQGAELEVKDFYDRTPLSIAAENGHEVLVRLLLEQGAELETKDNSGRTPLFLAAQNGHEALVRLLLEQGAELETKDDSGNTPQFLAAQNGHEAVIQLLLEKGAQW